MWYVKLNNKELKTFRIYEVYNFIIENPTTDYAFQYNYISLSKAEFLKTYLRISQDYDNYLNLEKSLISKKSREKWLTKTTKQ